ncbi:hypothetical protein [Bdellovibrio sp. HCB337]|uniref:hypothetical protein n=1 Tax=Bdellovibrio sp. HCB337 TaxID=3394358 RepID=UPI0039A6552F
METIRRYLQVWDPIGVIEDLAQVGSPLNEYDSYAGPIYTLLTQGGSVDDIEKHLNTILQDRMEMTGDTEKTRMIAEGLHRYFHEYSGYRK